MPQRGKEDKMRGVAKKKIEGRGFSGEGKKDEMLGGCEKKLRGGVMPERVKKTKFGERGGGFGNNNFEGGYAGGG